MRMTRRTAPFPITDLRDAAHDDSPLGRWLRTPVFFEDPPTPPAPTPPAPTPPAPTPGPAPQPTPPANDPLATLAAHVDAAAAGARTEGERAATEAALKALGFDSLEAATTFVKAKREADLAAMTEADRKAAEATAAQATADQEKAAAASERRQLLVTECLVLSADLPAERREAVRAQLAGNPALSALDVAADRNAAATAVLAAIDTLRKDPAMAVLFTPVTPDPANPPTPGSFVPGPSPTPHVPKLKDDVATIVKGITERTGIK